MKVGLLTFHRADSYGANLQAYALYSVLNQFGCDVEIIDYRCNAIEDVYKPAGFPKIRKNMVAFIKSVFVYLCVHKDELRKIENFNKFRSNMKMSLPVRGIDDKKEIEKKYDIVITGSDQIWNSELTHGPNDWYCYRKESKSKLVVASYAGSAGSVRNFSKYENCFAQILRKYDFIGVREDDLQQYLKKILNCEVYQTIDPTLLIDSSVWDKLAGEKPLIEEDYILNFDVQINSISEKFAKLYAREKNKKIVVLDANTLTIGRKVAIRDAGPLEFLNIVKFADAVVSSSFHGIALSIALHKKIFPALHPTTGARMYSLLENLGLANQVIHSDEDYLKALEREEVDYSDVEEKLQSIRKDSLDYLCLIVDRNDWKAVEK